MSSAYADASENVGSQAACLVTKDIKAMGRYYNYGAGGKVLPRTEATALTQNGIALWAVFQFWACKAAWFTSTLGNQDAIRALQCAKEIIGQPEGSAIYFGVDYDETGTNYASNIMPYFEAVEAAFMRPDGTMPYRIGVYGNGLVCQSLLTDGLVTHTWLSGSPGHTGHAAFYASKRWNLAQSQNTVMLCTKEVDMNEASATLPDYGQFDHLVPLTASHRFEEAAKLLPEFLKRANEIDKLTARGPLISCPNP